MMRRLDDADADLRLFLALDLPPEAETALARVVAELARIGADVRWVGRGKAHLTLKFLGATDPRRVPEVEAALDALHWPSGLALALHGLGRFPPRGPARVVWAGLEGDVGPLGDLAASLDEQMAACGFPRESRPFAPHVTLGRVRGPRALRDLDAAIERASPGFHVDLPRLCRVVLYRSELAPGGSRYTPLREYRLR